MKKEKKATKRVLNYKYRLKLSKKQEKQLDQEVFLYNQAYNVVISTLKKETKIYREITTGDIPLPKPELIKPAKNSTYREFFEKTDSELDNLVKLSLSQRELYSYSDNRQGARATAKKAFWDRYKVKGRGAAKFKVSGRVEGSFLWPASRTKIEEKNGKKFLNLSRKLKDFRVVWDRDIPGKIKSVRIKREITGYYVIFASEVGEIESFSQHRF